MPEKISKEEMLVRTAIIKAKEAIQEAGHLGIIENKDPVMGEEVKVKRPPKNPKEEKIDNPVADDDTSSGYGHAGSKEYFGKAFDLISKLNPKTEKLLDELQAELAEADEEKREEVELLIHQTLQEILGSKHMLSSPSSRDSEFRDEDEIEERRTEDRDSEWKAVLKRTGFPYPQEYWDAQSDEDIAGYNAEMTRRTGSNVPQDWTRRQLAGSSTEGPMYRNWHEGTGVYSPDRQGQFARQPQPQPLPPTQEQPGQA